MLKKLVLLILLLNVSLGFSQDDYGIAHSNYAPTKTFLHNPTNSLDNKVWLDVHLIGAGTFVYNNFLYMKGTQFAFFPNIVLGREWPDYQFNLNDSKKGGYQDSDFQLISAAIQYKNHGFAFSTRLRTHFDFRRISPGVGLLLTEGTYGMVDYYDQILSAENMYMNQMSYAEYALSYSNTFYHFAHETMGAGLTLKILNGYTGAGVRVKDLEFNIQDPNTTDFFVFDGTVAYGTGPNDGNSNIAGSGVAFDLGFVYKKTLHNVTHYEPYSEASACEPYDYKYKISAAIVDLGYINFNKNAQRYDVESDLSATNFDGNELTFGQFGSFANDNFTNVETADKFRMLTPAALNLMVDYNYQNYYYLSGMITQGVPRRASLGVRRPDVWALTGRYQRKWFEGSLTASMFNYEDLRLGTALRFGYFTIGTDKLLSMMGIWDFYGTDLYFNLRFYLTKRPGCKRKEKEGGKRNSADCVKN